MKPSHLRALAVLTVGAMLTGGAVALTGAPAGAVSPLLMEVSPSPSVSASPTVSSSPTASATPTATVAPSPTGAPSECTGPTTITASPTSLVAGNVTHVPVSGASSSVVRLFAAVAPTDSYRQVREQQLSGTTVTFSVFPATNVTMYAQQVGCDPSETVAVQVASAIGIAAVRNGVRDYTFSGSSNPRRPGQLVALYRVTSSGARVLTARVRTDSAGRWTVRRSFTGSGRFGFVARTGTDATNAAGSSRVRSTLIY